jgi:hypothetical protein
MDNKKFDMLIDHLSAISGAIEDLTQEVAHLRSVGADFDASFRDTFRYPIEVKRAVRW